MFVHLLEAEGRERRRRYSAYSVMDAMKPQNPELSIFLEFMILLS
jgi:hypothetical protein